MARKRSDDDEPRQQRTRPQPYPLDEAIETAYAPEPGLLPAEEPSATGDSWLDGDSSGQPDGSAAGDGSREAGRAAGSGSGAAGVRGGAAGEAWDSGARSLTASPARACDASAEPPATLDQQLAALRPWQARYVLQLMECGGIAALACVRSNVSRQSVEEHQQLSPAFASACAAAVQHSTDLVEAAVFRGATIGDTQPVYQGGLLVGYKRQRSTKDAELMLKLRGKLLGDDAATGRGTARVQLVAREDLPAIVRDVAAKLFAARQAQRRPVLDAATGKPVENSAILQSSTSNRVNGPQKAPFTAPPTPDPAPETAPAAPETPAVDPYEP